MFKKTCSSAAFLLLCTFAVAFAQDFAVGLQKMPVLYTWYVLQGGEVIDQDSDVSKALIEVAKLAPSGKPYTAVGYPQRGKLVSVTIQVTDSAVTPIPVPDPVIPVPPELSAFEKEIKERSSNFKKDDCLKVAANYKLIALDISSGKIKSKEEAYANLVALNRPLKLPASEWGAFAIWLGEQFDAHATDLERAAKMMLEVSNALRVSGK